MRIRSCSKNIFPIVPQGNLTASIHSTTAAIAPDRWNGLVPGNRGIPDNPFLSHAFFMALEQSGSAVPETGWHPRHILLEQDNTPVGLLPLFAKSHSMGEYVFDQGWADAFEQAGGHYYPKLQSSIPFTPVTAPRLLVPSNRIDLKGALLDTAIQLAISNNLSSVHLTFVPREEEILGGQTGWLPRRDIQFHWQNNGFSNFEDFLSTLSSRKRKTIRKERKKALENDIQIEWISGNDITEIQWDHFFMFYQDTGARKWGTPYLTRSFFSLISETMPQAITLMLARQDGDYVAGALNFSSPTTLYGRYWGCTRNIPFLHFELCYYQAIDFAIAHGLRRVEAGAQGPHKLARGYQATPTRSIHWLTNPSLREAVKNYLEQERTAIAQNQHTLEQAAPFARKPD